MDSTKIELRRLREWGIACLRSGNHEACYSAFTRAISISPRDAYLWYGAGYAARRLQRFDESIRLLARSAELDPSEPATHLALGIARQLNGELDAAIPSFAAAIRLDDDYAEAYNSLALTQKRKGEFEKSIHNYEQGTNALARRFVRNIVNARENRIFKRQETAGREWNSCAVFGALFHAAHVSPTTRVSFPTGEQALEEEYTEAHAGLLWLDLDDVDGTLRHFLPNYFNSFRAFLRSEPLYATLIGNRGLVLELLGRNDEARDLLNEADEFCPEGW